MTSAIRRSWAVIEAWCAQHAPRMQLPRGASRAKLAAIERAVGRPLPRGFVALYTCHDGDDEHGIFGGWSLMAAKEIAREHVRMKRMLEAGTLDIPAGRHARIRQVWWSAGWVPFVASGSGHFICCDLDPKRRGDTGQIILFLHDEPRRFRLADSCADWLARIARDLARRRYAWSPDDGFAARDEAFLRSMSEASRLYV